MPVNIFCCCSSAVHMHFLKLCIVVIINLIWKLQWRCVNSIIIMFWSCPSVKCHVINCCHHLLHYADPHSHIILLLTLISILFQVLYFTLLTVHVFIDKACLQDHFFISFLLKLYKWLNYWPLYTEQLQEECQHCQVQQMFHCAAHCNTLCKYQWNACTNLTCTWINWEPKLPRPWMTLRPRC